MKEKICACKCENCGAPLRGNICEYCGTEYYTPLETQSLHIEFNIPTEQKRKICEKIKKDSFYLFADNRAIYRCEA